MNESRVSEILIHALFSCDNEDSCAHKITVYVKYSEISPETIEAVPLVEGCVDSEGEEAPDPGVTDTVVTCDNDTVPLIAVFQHL